MGEVTSVSIDTSTENIEKTPEQYVAEAEATAAQDAPPRPDWLPEKFETPEAMAAAYANLEKKMGSAEAQDEPKALTRDTLLQNENIDLSALEKEYQEKGELSPDSYEAAEKAGFTRDVVDKYIAGQQAIVDAQVTEIFEYSGGREQYIDLIEWAGDALSEPEIDSFNKTIASNDVAAIKLAISGLKARKAEGEPKEPLRQIEGGTPATADRFESWAQVKEAMSDPRYETDPAYNNSVVQKIGRSNL